MNKPPKTGSRLTAKGSHGYEARESREIKKQAKMPWLKKSETECIDSIEKLLEKRNQLKN